MNKRDSSEKRFVHLDALKVVSMFMIVVWHFYIHGMQVDDSFEIDATAIGFTNCFLSQFVLIVCSVCVDVYVLITGYFLILKKFKFARLFRVWFVSVFYGAFLTTIIYLFHSGVNTPKDIVKSFFPIYSNSYWFVRQYLGLMIVSPFISLAACSMRKEIYELLILMLVLVGTTFIKGFPFGDSMRFMRGYSLAWFVCLFMVGGYFRRFGFPIKKERAAYYFFSLSFLLWLYSIIIIFLNYYLYGTSLIIIEYNYNGIPFFLAVLLFCWFGQIEIKNTFFSFIICNISSLVFGVYLIHDNLSVRELLWKRSFQWTDLYNNVWLLPIAIGISLFIFLLCVLCEFIRKKLFFILGVDYMVDRCSQMIDKFMKRYGIYLKRIAQ